MSTRECLTAALNGEIPDKTPFSAYEQFFYDYKNEPPHWDHRQCPDLRKLLEMGLGLTLHVWTIHYDMQGVEVEVKQLEKEGQSHRIERWTTPVGAVEKLHVDGWQTEFDLSFTGFETNNKILMNVYYLASLFKHSTIQGMVSNYIEILEEVLKNGDVKIDEIILSHELLAGKSESCQDEYTKFTF